MAGELRNFSFIEDGKVAGMAFPNTPLDKLNELDVELVISLTEHTVPDDLKGSFKGEFKHVPVPDFQAPTVEQLADCVNAIEAINKKNKAAVVHCQGGMGRTGTILAAWLVANKKLPVDEAITQIRALRPRSVETDEQVESIRKFASSLENL